METIPPRVNELEQQVHTMKYMIQELKNDTAGTPERIARLESAVQDIPEIRRKISEINDIIQKSFAKLYGIGVGLGLLFGIMTYGPKILKFLGGA